MKFLHLALLIMSSSILFGYGQDAEKAIEKILTDIGYDFGITEDGIYYVTLEFEDSRTQLVRIEPFKSSLTNKVQFDIWSPISAYTLAIPDSIAHKMFIESAELDIGSFQSYKSEDGYLLVFSAIFYGKFNRNILESIISEVAAVSDIFEFELTQKDDY